MQNLYDVLIKKLEQNEKFLLEDNVSASKVRESAYKLEPELIKILLDEPKLKEQFFQKVDGVDVFHYQKFSDFISNKQFLPDSYTKFETTVGLTTNDKFLSKNKDVVLSFPHKDCILEGGMDKEDAEARKEVFYNQTLAPDDVHKLKSPKALKNWKKYGVDVGAGFTRPQKDTNGSINASPTELKLNPDGTFDENFIIKGNNLLGLYSLLPRYRGKIKLIYIDPPYNTGNDGFKYNDNFNHSTWLVFMKNRLEVARDLLRDDGSIWMNIDDREAHYLKVLADEVFGRDNFVANVIWQKKYTISNDAKYFSDNHDHVLVFAKNKGGFNVNGIKRTDEQNERYQNPDNDKNGNWMTQPLHAKSGNNTSFEFTFKNGVKWSPPRGTFPRYSENSLKKFDNENKIWFGKDGKAVPRLKKYLKDMGDITPATIWFHGEVGNNDQANREVKVLIKDDLFTTPKPERLMQRIVELATNENDIVLDYHLGSGTTCAVAHKMGRRYIGIEQMDYVETIAVERLKKVIGVVGENLDSPAEGLDFGTETGDLKIAPTNFKDFDTGGISKAVNWQGGGSFVYCELAKNNLEYLEKIDALTSKNKAWEVFEELADSIWISYRTDVDKFKGKKGEFMAMELKDQKQVLRDIINYNHLYVNHEDMDDAMYASCGLTKQDKALTKEFYEGGYKESEEIL